MSETSRDLPATGASDSHVAEIDMKLGGFSLSGRLSISTSGLAAVAALVGVVLGGTAAIVWTATGPARRRAETGKSAM